jgi:hypothetical protein
LHLRTVEREEVASEARIVVDELTLLRLEQAALAAARTDLREGEQASQSVGE